MAGRTRSDRRNQAACALYGSFGFERYGLETDAFKVADDFDDLAYMAYGSRRGRKCAARKNWRPVSQSAGRVKARRVEACVRWLGLSFACRAPSGALPRSHALSWPWVHPCIPREAAEWPAPVGNASLRTRSHCTDCRCPDKNIGMPSTGSCRLRGTRMPPPRFFRSGDSATRSRESTSIAKPRSDRRLIGLRNVSINNMI
jgi:hypothetical protein